MFHTPSVHMAVRLRERTAMRVSPVTVPREACEITGQRAWTGTRLLLSAFNQLDYRREDSILRAWSIAAMGKEPVIELGILIGLDPGIVAGFRINRQLNLAATESLEGVHHAL